MNLDFLISRAGLRVAAVDVAITGVRLARGSRSLVPRSAERVSGSMTFTLADLTAALARPEVLDQVMSGFAGVARPELTLAEAPDGGIRLVGSVELMGRRFPVSAVTHVRVAGERIVVSAGRIEGLPLVGLLPSPLPDFVLPVALPAGLAFTGVSTGPDGLVVRFEGTDVPLGTSEPSSPKPAPPRPTPRA